MTVPTYGGCPWPMDPACRTDDWEALDPSVQERALALASSSLHRLTGGRVGGCPVTVRPCSPGARGCPDYMGSGFWRGDFVPLNWAGRWTNVCFAYGCSVTGQVKLPAPVGRVDQVKVNGSVLNSTDYRVDSHRFLVNLTDTRWPDSQDLSLPDTEPGTFSVTYLNAYPVDSLGAYAVGVLALEYGYACSGRKCRLPSGVTSIVRQGISMEIASGAFPDGMTGIREVDAFIALWNPQGLTQPARVWSPDLPVARTVGGTP